MVVAGERGALTERRAGQLGPEVLEQQGHALERAVGQLARRGGTGPVEQLVDDRVERGIQPLNAGDGLVDQFGR